MDGGKRQNIRQDASLLSIGIHDAPEGVVLVCVYVFI